MGRVSDYRLEAQQTPEYQEGWEAFVIGMSACPYPIATAQHTSWMVGWDDARNEEQSP